MQIGALARQTGCPIQTIRFYEQEGLLPPPSRSAGNFRLYGDAHVERLLFIRRCRSLDMTLDEIRVLLRLKNVPTQDCSEVNRVLEAHIEQVAVRETPDDFNGLKASLAFVNVDKSCSDASLRPAGRSADLFKAVPVASLQRRSINPVNLSVQLVCANTNVGAPLDLGMLKAGERYKLVESSLGTHVSATLVDASGKEVAHTADFNCMPG